GPDIVAGLVVVRLLEPEVVAFAGDQFAVQVPDARRVVGVREVLDLARDELLPGVPEHVAHRLVHLGDAAVDTGDRDADRGLREDRAEPRLARPARLLGPRPRPQGRGSDLLLLVEYPVP